MATNLKHNLKERLTDDLKRAKAEGSLRADRIRAIFRQAVAQALHEVEAGSTEVRHVARDAMQTAFDQIRGTAQTTEEEMSAALEGTVEGIVERQQRTIAATQTQIQQLQTEAEQAQTQLQSDVEGALTEIEQSSGQVSSDLQEWVRQRAQALRDTEGFAVLMEQYAKLKAKLAVLDANLAARYGERYEEVKDHLDQAKIWYDKARVQAEDKGITPVEETQVGMEQRFSELGAAAARRERAIKTRLQELWESIKHA